MHLLIIDPQNDFMDLSPSMLPVAGACADMERVAALIGALGDKLTDITVTLDSHQHIAIDRTSFWLDFLEDSNGKRMAQFTDVSLATVRNGIHQPRDPAALPLVLSFLEELEARGYQHKVWPVHCVEGTWGHNVYEPLMEAVEVWEDERARNAFKLRKGMNPWTEQYGAFAAVVPVNTDPTTQLQKGFIMELAAGTAKGPLLVAGEASSRCVKETMYQMVGHPRHDFANPIVDAKRVVILHDCMSPVHGERDDHMAFLGFMAGRGARLMSAKQAALEFAGVDL